jgi:hypothetical protein
MDVLKTVEINPHWKILIGIGDNNNVVYQAYHFKKGITGSFHTIYGANAYIESMSGVKGW